jgi:hypothetical protein
MVEMPLGPAGKGIRVFDPVVPRKEAHRAIILRRQNQAAAGRVLQSVVCVCVCVSCVLSLLCFCLTVLLVCFLACCV